MKIGLQLKNQHLLWRAGFGVSVSDIAELSTARTEDLYATIRSASGVTPKSITIVNNTLKQLFTGYKSAGNKQPGEMQNNFAKLSADSKKGLRRQNVENLRQLTVAWQAEMIISPAQLREKLSLFWHGHFASRVINIYFQQLLLNAIRANAVGNFGDLLKAVSKSASMLSFLNNQQNRKQHPNENFAREVMELFTMGRGNYTEQDVKEAARAFTGWGFDADGNFTDRPFFHDNGSKVFLGKEGNFNGDDILNIILEQKETAVFITQKIYRYFVSDAVDHTRVSLLAARFYQSNYNIQSLMNDIFTGDWFYEEKNIGAIIKSPVQLMVGIRRILPVQIENEGLQLLLQKALGQLLFYPPNVAGWPGGKSWIDSSTLMLRLRLPQLLKDDDTFYLTAKQDDDVQMGMTDKFSNLKKGNNTALGNDGFQLRANIDWTRFTKRFAAIRKEELYSTLHHTLLQVPLPSINENALNGITDNSSRETYIQSTAIALMSTPEYQLC